MNSRKEMKTNSVYSEYKINIKDHTTHPTKSKITTGTGVSIFILWVLFLESQYN